MKIQKDRCSKPILPYWYIHENSQNWMSDIRWHLEIFIFFIFRSFDTCANRYWTGCDIPRHVLWSSFNFHPGGHWQWADPWVLTHVWEHPKLFWSVHSSTSRQADPSSASANRSASWNPSGHWVRSESAVSLVSSTLIWLSIWFSSSSSLSVSSSPTPPPSSSISSAGACVVVVVVVALTVVSGWTVDLVVVVSVVDSRVVVVVVVVDIIIEDVVWLFWMAGSSIAGSDSPSTSSFSSTSSCDEMASSSEHRKEPTVLMHVPVQVWSMSSSSHSFMSVTNLHHMHQAIKIEKE